MIEEKIENKKIMLLINDSVFKSVFADNSKFLLMFIKGIFKTDNDSLTNVVGYETVPSRIHGKTYRSDIIVKLSNKNYIIIEMNKSRSRRIIDRNQLQLFRICNRILPKGLEDKELVNFKIKLLNLNLINNSDGSALENCGLCSYSTKEKISDIYEISNLDLEKSRYLVYNNDIEKLPKHVRWGAILLEDTIEGILKILGKDMMSMEDKKEFETKIRELNDDERIMEQWVADESARLAFADEKETAYCDGIEDNRREVIINMLKAKADYNFISQVTGKTIEEIKEYQKSYVV